MKNILSLCMVGLLSLNASAQDETIKDLKKAAEKNIAKDPKDTTVKVWKKGGLFNLNVNQGSLSNWSAGGEKFSFSLNSYLNLYAFYKKAKHSWDNSLDLAYGIVKTTSLGSRKASDRIDLTSKYGYAISRQTNVAVLFNGRSQFANGYTYLKSATGTDSAALTSKTLMPAYLLLALGLDYQPIENFSLFVSPVTVRVIIVGDEFLAPIYGLDPGKSSKNEIGAFLSANYLQKINKTMSFKTKLDLFSNYRKKPGNIDIFWTNVLSAKLIKYINFNFNVDLIYDDDTNNVNPEKGPAPQILQLMGIGFAYNFNN